MRRERLLHVIVRLLSRSDHSPEGPTHHLRGMLQFSKSGVRMLPKLESSHNLTVPDSPRRNRGSYFGQFLSKREQRMMNRIIRSTD